MKRLISILLAVAMLVGILPVTVFAQSVNSNGQITHPFSDVPKGSWYEEYLQYVWEHGLFVGTSSNEYSPESTFTRAMFVTVLGRMEKIDLSAYTQKVFDDVAPESWYGPYVAWAVQAGITNGISVEAFAPDQEVTREQIAVFTHRYLNSKGLHVDAEELTYHDKGIISEYAVEAVGVCSSIGIFVGDERGSFNPLNSATRAEAAAVFTRLHKYIGSAGTDASEYCKVTFAYPDAMTDELKESISMEGSVTVEKGTLMYTLPLPTAMGYIFGGWFYDSALTQLVASEETVTEDITLYPYLFECEAEDEVIYTPNFTAALEVSARDYFVTIAAKDEETLRTALFIHSVTEGDVEREPVITDNGDGTYNVVPEGGFIEGGTYQFKALDRLDESIPVEDYIRFVENGEVLGASVQFYNVTVAKEQYNKLRLNDEIKYISIDKVEGFSFEDTALIEFELSGETVSAEENNATGSFIYQGTDLNIGDIVAIHDGIVDEENPSVEHCDHASYVRITGIDANRYNYETPGVEEVIFIPEVLPVPKGVEEGVDLAYNGDNTYTLTVYNEYLDYAAYPNPNVSVKADADEGDFVVLHQGEVFDANNDTEAEFYEITAVNAGNAVTELTLRASSFEDIQNSVGFYEEQALDMTLTDEEIAELEAEIAAQASESGFAEETAKYIASMLEASGNAQMPEGFDPDSVRINVLDQDGNYIPTEQGAQKDIEADAGVYTYNVKLGKVDIEAHLSNDLQEINAFHGDIGIRAELAVYVPLEIQQVLIGGSTQNPGEWNTVLSSLKLELTASFVQEVAIKTNFDVDLEWDYVVVPSEIVLDLDMDVGTYTGMGVIVSMSTGAYDTAYDFDSFISAFDSTYDPGNIKIGNLAKTLEAMMNEPYKFFGVESDGNSLLSDYQELMNDELEYVDLLAYRLTKKDFYLPPVLKIVHLQLIVEAVVSAKASISLGASFEHLDVKRYSFHVRCFDGEATRNVTNLQNNYTNFNFYAMGNIGLRAGFRFDFRIGIISTKIANLGIVLETGPCLNMYGFFYFHYDKQDGREPNMYHGGMYLIEIGWYLLFDFRGGVFKDLVGFNVHFVEEEWYFWRSGDGKFIVAPEQASADLTVGSGHNITSFYTSTVGRLFLDAIQVREVDIRTGLTTTLYPRLEDFDIVCTNPAFVLDINEMYRGTVSVIPPTDPSIQTIEGQIRLTYKHGTVPMSNTPIVSVINLKWTKTYPYGYIYFRDSDLNWLGEGQTFVEGTHPSGIQYPDYTPPAGYTWEGKWQYYHSGVNEDGSYYHEYLLFDPETYVMKSFEYLYLEPVLTPSSGIPYTINHYIESLEKPGTYELYQTDEKTGTTGEDRSNLDTITIDGFQYNRNRSGGYYYYHPYYDLMLAAQPDNIIKGDGSLVIEYYYDRISYGVSLYADNINFRWYSDMEGESSYTQLPYGSTIDEAPFRDVEIPGYRFAGWRDELNPDAPLLATLPIVTGRAIYSAVWMPRDDTPYTVTHYIMQSDGNYEAALTESFTGTTGATIDTKAIADAAIENNPELFKSVTYRYADDRGHYDPEQNYTILGGGYTKIGLYYNREYYRAYWYGLGDMPIVSYFYEGQTITAPEQIPEAPVGYKFSHWKGLTADTVMGSDHMSFTPAFEGLEGIPYTVIHVREDGEYYYDVESEYYTETEIMYGKAGTAPTVNYRSYTGFTAIPYEAGDTVILGGGTLTIVVKYQRNRYSLTMDANGGTLSHYRSSYAYGISYELPTATREGYTFVCWYLKGDPNETPVKSIDCFALTDLTYVVKWKADPIDYKVAHYLQELDGSYGEPRVITQTGIIDTEVTALTSEFVGFTYDESNALNVTTGYIADAAGNIADADGNAIVLKLYYTRNSYTATWYDYDGSKLADEVFLYGAEIILPTQMAQPQRQGYTFAGWNDFGTMGTENASFYAATHATWNANAYTVRFNANGGTGTMKDQSFVYGQAQKLSANAFQYVNRNFIGWSTTPNGEVEYTNNQSVSDLASENGAVVTLYAVWELIEGATAQYTIAHYTETLSGGYEKYSETTGYGLIGQERTITAADAVSIDGFTFDPDAANVLTATVKEDGSTLFEMYYSRNRYELTLDYGDEQIKVAVEDEDYRTHIVTKEEDPERAIADKVLSVRYGEELSAYLTDLENEIGYTFAGWDNSVATMPAENITVTAQWSPVEVTVTFHPGTNWFFPDDADLDAAAITQTYHYGEEVSLPEGLLDQFRSMMASDPYVETGWIFGTTQGSWPTLSHLPLILVEGYYADNPTFRELATDEEGNYLYDDNDEYIYTDKYSVVIAPYWSASYDVVAFDANGGEGSMESMNVDSYGYRGLPTCTFIREGYVFAGWNTAPDGSGTAYGIYDSFSGSSSGNTTTTLYAQWEKAT